MSIVSTTPFAFTLCPSFHGATLLSLLLNAHPEVCSLGDTYPLEGLDGHCSCGQTFRECPLWRRICDRVEPFGPEDPDLFLPELPKLVTHRVWNLRLNHLVRRVAFRIGPGVWSVNSDARNRFLLPYLEFCRTVRNELCANLMVDGHKSVVKAATVVSMLPRHRDVRIIHLTRDPRAFLSSCRKYDWPHSTEEIAEIWRAYHSEAAKVTARSTSGVRGAIVRYEDLAVETEQTMDRVYRFLGYEPPPFRPGSIDPSAFHLLGNNMLDRWDGTIQLDGSWRERLTRDEQRRMFDLTSDLAREYGYSDG